MRLTIFLIAILAASTSAVASDASHEAAALRLLEVSRASQMMDQVYDSLTPQFVAMAEQMGIEGSQREIFDRHMTRVFEVMREEMSWEKMEPHLVSAYTEVYTEKELMELVDFYESPVGQKFLEKMPELMDETIKMTQSMMGEFYGRIEELQAELQADIEASKADDR